MVFTWLSRMSFFWQLLLLVGLLVILPLVMSSFAQQYYFSQALLDSRSEKLWSLANEKRNRLSLLVETQQDFVSQMSVMPLIQGSARFANLATDHFDTHDSYYYNELKQFSKDFIRLHRHEDVLLFDQHGDIAFSYLDGFEQGANIFEAQWNNSQLADLFTQTLVNKQPHIHPYRYYEPAAELAAFIAAPVLDTQGESIGVVMVRLGRDWLTPFTQQNYGLGQTGEIVLGYITDDGKVNFLLKPKYTINRAQQKAILKNADLPLPKSVFIGDVIGTSIDYRGEPILAAWLNEPNLGLGIVVKQDLSEVLAPIHRQSWIFFAWSLCLTALISWLIWRVSHRFADPLRRISEKIKWLRRDPLGYRSLDPAIATSAELRTLIEELNQEASNMSQNLMQLQSQSECVTRQANELAVLNEHLSELIEDRTRSLNEYWHLIDQEIITSKTDLDGNIIMTSSAFCRISGYSEAELIGKNHRIVRHPDMPSNVYSDLWQQISAGKTWHGELKNMAKDGSYYWVYASISATYDRLTGEKNGYVAIRQDITDRKRVELLSITDEMTGLYNRRHFVQQLTLLQQKAEQTHQLLAFMMIDIDHFKQFNDRQGHLAGDDALIQVARSLRQTAEPITDAVFRLGGEEMAIISLVDRVETSQALAEKVRLAVEALAIEHPGNSALSVVTVSIGLYCYHASKDNHTIDQIYKHADDALYQAKSQGRNRVIVSELCV